MKIKFNQIQDLNDARYASAALSEWVGFTLNQLPIGKVQEIIGWCAGPKLTVELTQANNLETAISWCTILPVNTLECAAEEFDFWHTHIPNPQQYEWIVSSTRTQAFISFANHPNNNVYFHLYALNIEDVHSFLELVPNQENAIVNVSNLLNELQQIVDLSLCGISINCEPEIILGEKNFEKITELFELLDIF